MSNPIANVLAAERALQLALCTLGFDFRIGNGQLADVVQQRAVLDLLDQRLGQFHGAGNGRRDAGHAPGVRMRLGRTRAHHRHHGVERGPRRDRARHVPGVDLERRRIGRRGCFPKGQH